ncbi:adenosylcobinamide-GDP ribazoletransferase [Raineya orbicola]|uniref:Adenosylcobinamide-GDP ribazoletransferase n=1 Tax=Raineya orbicola TaxID=2016530 RepID=A0A2N3IG36_9BACT|nr:adenosylcobinamide-GDP ribazoletransferase [Raineya orbicola]PKQ69280.1 cobS: cobalamin 5'-phosphate synthase [Raineya orbicola]
MREQIRVFWVALMFYTRIPCPKNTPHNPEFLNKATRFFPLIGWIVGGISFLAFWGSSQIWNFSFAVLISLAVGILVTGAFHEDGLADTFDGFGGGWNKEKILEIMKDSRIGTFGVIALLVFLSAKFLTLKAVLEKESHIAYQLFIFFTYHSLARLNAANIIFTSQYAREDEKSKAKPIAKNHGKTEILCVYLFGLVPLIFLSYWKVFCLLVLVPLLLLFFFAKRYFEKWIGGYTGDCLGAVEQLSECCVLLTFEAVWKFS